MEIRAATGVFSVANTRIFGCATFFVFVQEFMVTRNECDHTQLVRFVVRATELVDRGNLTDGRART